MEAVCLARVFIYMRLIKCMGSMSGFVDPSSKAAALQVTILPWLHRKTPLVMLLTCAQTAAHPPTFVTGVF